MKNRKKILSALVMTTLISSNIAGAAGFSDLAEHWGKKNIEKIQELGIIKGYPDNTFKPDNSVTREETAAILYRSLSELDKVDSDTDFTDIEGRWGEKEIQYLASVGLIKGYPDHTFKPEQGITRAEMAVLLERVIRPCIGDVKAKGDKFSDIGKHYAEKSIDLLAEFGIIKGYEDGTFAPDKTITRAELSVMLERCLAEPKFDKAFKPEFNLDKKDQDKNKPVDKKDDKQDDKKDNSSSSSDPGSISVKKDKNAPSADKFVMNKSEDQDRLSFDKSKATAKDRAWWKCLNEKKNDIKVYVNGVQKSEASSSLSVGEDEYALGKTDSETIFYFNGIKENDVIRVECPGYKALELKYSNGKLVKNDGSTTPVKPVDELADKKKAAIDKVNELKNLTAEEKKDYEDQINSADSEDKINDIVEAAKKADEAKKPEEPETGKEAPEVSEFNGDIIDSGTFRVSPKSTDNEWWKALKAAGAELEIKVNDEKQTEGQTKYVSKGKYYIDGDTLCLNVAADTDIVKIEMPGYKTFQFSYEDFLGPKREAAKSTVNGLQNLEAGKKQEYIAKIEKAKNDRAINKIVEDAQKADKLAGKKKEAKEQVNGLQNLTEEDKKVYNDRIDSAYSEAAVDSEVEKAKETDNLAAKKKEAKGKIDGLDKLSQEEKQCLQQRSSK